MRTALRAMIAVTLLIGYYIIALAVFAITGLALFLAVRDPGLNGTIQFAGFMLILSAPLIGALVRTARHRTEPPGGLPADRAAEPALWAEIDTLAAQVGTRPPDELRFVPDVNAAVTEETRRLGLAAGRRHMIIGVPLLETLTVAQLRGVLGHELGHYSGRHTRLGGITYRGAVALRNTSAALRSDDTYMTALRKVFDGYAWMYLRVSQAVRRTQEIEADRFMVEIAGRDAAASALRTVRTTAAAWSFFLDRHAGPGTRYGLVPADLFGGFRALLTEPSRQDELRAFLAEPEERDPHDSHPILADRLAAIEHCPEPGDLTSDTRPATTLLTDPAAVRDRLGAALFGADSTALSWDDLATRTNALDAAEDALALLTAAERTTGSGPATLGTVLTDLEQGHGPAIADELSRGRDASEQQRTAMLTARLRSLACSALLAAGHLTARFSWSGAPIRHTGPDGTEIDFEALVPEDLGPDHAAELRTRLTGRGADLEHRPAPPRRTGVALHGVLHGIQDEEGNNYDGLVLEIGILLVPISLKEAMRGTMTDLPIRERIQNLLNQPPGELIARDDTWLLEADAFRRGTFWSKKETWVFRLLLDWVDEDGDACEGEARIVGRRPCTPPQEAREALEALLGSRLEVSSEKI